MIQIRHMEVYCRSSGHCLTLLSTLFLIFLMLIPEARAALREQDIPPQLSPWVNWVLPDQGQLACPRTMDETAAFFCAWPGRLHLSEGDQRVRFRQSWTLYDQAWVPLPGESGSWPEEVRVDGRDAAVIDRKGVPHVQLSQGTHEIQGMIEWQQRPTSIQLPYRVGLIEVEDAQGPPVIDERYRLQLTNQAQPSGLETQPRALEVTVARLLDDRIPQRLETRVSLKVSGDAREVSLGRALPEGFRLLAFETPLPARLGDDGMLRVQLRPGQWTISFTARAVSRDAEPGPDPQAGGWPQQEFWAFRERPELRQVEIGGAPRVEPGQVPIPGEWRHLPVFGLGDGDRLGLHELQRGVGNPKPAELRLQRELWLDFAGEGARIRDRIRGQMQDQSRLEALKRPLLGRVAVNGEPAMITRLPERESTGVEVRPERVNIETTAEVVADDGTWPLQLPVTGWLHTVNAVQWTFNLPPGWRLLATEGADRVSGSWLSQWSIWNLFLVLLVAVACGRTFGWKWALAALVFGLLLYQEHAGLVWLLLLVVLLTALWRNIGEGRLQKVVAVLRGGGLIAFAVAGLAVMAFQLRIAIYPQLAHEGEMTQGGPVSSPVVMQEAAPSGLKLADRMMSKAEAPARELSASQPSPLPDWDPDAHIQTGSGLPEWHWETAQLSWGGPVEATSRVSLWLLPPVAVSALRLLAIALIGLLTVRCFLGRGRDRGEDDSDNKSDGEGGSELAVSLLVLLVLGAGMGLPTPASAEDIPSPQLLDELKARLVAPPDCAPDCASERRTLLVLDGYGLTLTQQFSLVEPAVVTLPAHRDAWRPTSVVVDGEETDRLQFNDNGFLALSLAPGNHEVVLESDVREQDQLAVRFPTPSHRFNIKLEDWNVFGLVRGAPASETLRFERQQVSERRAESRSSLFAEPPPPFVEVARTLTLGNRWQVETVVSRVAPDKGPVEVSLPLLPGESVTSGAMEVSGDQVQVVIPANRQSVRWQGFIKPVDQLSLTAAAEENATEIWTLAAGPQWHVESSLLPPVQRRGGDGYWRPTWHPRAGESLLLSISRPEAVPGRTLTVERLGLNHQPGGTLYQGQYELAVRTSIADRLQWQLPERMALKSVRVDGESRPLLDDANTLDVALDAGLHHIELGVEGPWALEWAWQSPQLVLPWPVTNVTQQVALPRDRWLLYAASTGIGPAVLYWSILPLLLILAAALGRHERNPLGFGQWLLLGLGLSLANPWSAVLIVAWFYAMADRSQRAITEARWFNLRQVGLVALTLISFIALLVSVPYGLLAEPAMWVTGNGSSASHLNWYLDQAASGAVPTVHIWSLPLWGYRLAMLLWSLWLAVAVVDWLRWGWRQLTEGGGWQPLKTTGKPLPPAPRSRNDEDWDQS
ncbi:hypothetical protein QQM79_19060 [Marinobacteraceae bacterium S3BR75-40.1]